jgi:TetR/AcrR family transcriptional regulator, transcriptional repressor of bet genes
VPKVGQQPVRRAALVSATIQEIGRAGSLDVTVGQIAKSAGMSTALAHYYFDSKNALFLAAMRHILGEFGTSVRRRLKKAHDPRARLAAIIDASLGRDQFAEHVVSAWLVFYVEAQRSPPAARLLRIYSRRLHSNLVHELRQIVPLARADRIAKGTGALIDGIYIRKALQDENADLARVRPLVREYIDLMLAADDPINGKDN